MENKGRICGWVCRQNEGEREGRGHTLNAEMEDEMESVAVCVWEDRIRMTSPRDPARKPRPPPPAALPARASPHLLPLASIHLSPFFSRRPQSRGERLLIPVVGPGDTDWRRGSSRPGWRRVANANPLCSLLARRVCQLLERKQTGENRQQERREASN